MQCIVFCISFAYEGMIKPLKSNPTFEGALYFVEKLQKFLVLLNLKSQILLHKKSSPHDLQTMILGVTVCNESQNSLSRFMQPANFAFQKLKQFQFLFLFTSLYSV